MKKISRKELLRDNRAMLIAIRQLIKERDMAIARNIELVTKFNKLKINNP